MLRSSARSVVVVALVVTATALTGCADTSAVHGPAVEAYVEPGSPTAAIRVRAAAERAGTIGIDGVTLTADGQGLAPLPDGVDRLARAAARGGARPELLVSNYSETLGDFSPETASALLADPVARERVARELAALAHDHDCTGVQIDLESLRDRDRAGLVAFAAALDDAVHDELGAGAPVSMAVMASTSAAGFRDTGYDLVRLAEHVDRFVLMTYDQHGPGARRARSGPCRGRSGSSRRPSTRGWPPTASTSASPGTGTCGADRTPGRCRQRTPEPWPPVPRGGRSGQGSGRRPSVTAASCTGRTRAPTGRASRWHSDSDCTAWRSGR